MLRKEDVAEVLQRPEVLGRLVGFTDLTALHGQWIHEMVFGDEDYTLQAHRGAFKSSCLAVAIPLYMVLYPNRNVIFLRKTDHDVGEMMNMVAKVLQSDVMRDFTQTNRGVQLKITEQSMDHIRSARILDNEGNQPRDEVIAPGAPDYHTTVPVKEIVEQMKREGYEIEVSDDAGSFVCNDTFYLVGTNTSVPVVFIHAPENKSAAGTVQRFIELAVSE